MAFLNETGLATFLAYIKAWARSVFVSKTDTQTIEGAITFSQTVAGSISGNAATATKLATARTINSVPFDGLSNITVTDSSKVSKSGDTMTGVLNGTGVYISGTFAKKHLDVVKGTNPSSVKYWTLNFCDKNGIDFANNVIGQFETNISDSGVVQTYMRAMKNEAGSTTACGISCIYDTTNNVGYTAAPTPATNDNSTKIATTEFVKAQGYTTASGHTHNYLPLTGGTVTGNIVRKVPETRGVAPSVYKGYYVGTVFDAADNMLGGVITEYLQDKSSQTRLMVFDTTTATGSSIGSLGIKCTSSGTVETFAPTPVAADNSTKIATTAFVKAQGYITSGQDVQTTSDQRLKTKLEIIPDEVLDAWEDVEWGQFQYLEAVEEKGKSARLHAGLVSQQVQMAFSDRGLDACDYGLICHDNEKDLWMLRYAEALCMECAYQRRRANRLESRVVALEEMLHGK